MAEHHHIGPAVEVQLVLDLIRPPDDHPMRLGKALGRGEERTGVGDYDPEAQAVSDPAQFLRDVNGADDQEPWLGRHGLDIDLVLPVPEGAALLTVHQAGRVRDDGIEYVAGDGAGHEPVHPIEHRLGACSGTVHHGDGRPQPLLLDEATDRLQMVDHHFSTSTWMVPPQARPTSNASSSAMP